MSLFFISFGIALIAWQLWSESKVNFIFRSLTLIFLTLSFLHLSYNGFISQLNWNALSVSLICLSITSFIAKFIGKNSRTKLLYLLSSSIILLLCSSGIIRTPLSHAVEPNSSGIPELLVEVQHAHVEDFKAYCDAQDDIKIVEYFDPLYEEHTELDDYFVVDILGSSPKKIIERLQSLSFVEYVEENDLVFTPSFRSPKTYKNKKSYIFSDPLNKNQWALENTRMNDFYEIAVKQKPKKKIKLFILDTGVDGDHEDLKDVYVKSGKKNDKDKRGHGTHCAGIAAALTGNNVGISSFNFDKRIEIYSEKVLADFGGGTQAGIIKGIINAVDNGADVISMSLGGPSNDKKQKAYNEAVRYARDRNCIVVVAAGNSRSKALYYAPANSEGVITVAASDENNTLAEFSNTLEGIKMGVYAPGVNILSTFPNNSYETFSGTSMATPFVAGLISLMKSIKPELTVEHIYDILQSTMLQSNEVSIIDPKTALEKLVSS